MSPDPGSDRQLTAATVAIVVREQFGLAASSVEPLGAGWDNEVFAVDEEWVFRFPKRLDAVERMEREIAMMPVIERSLGPLVPRFEMLGRASELFAYPFVGYRRIHGVAADLIDRPGPSSELAADLGRAFTKLHSINASVMPPNLNEPWEMDVHRERLSKEAAHVAPFIPKQCAREAEPYLRGEVAPPPPLVGTRRFLHADINPHHVIVDPGTGRLAGIIDFGDAELSDPVSDFVGLVSFGGYGFAADVRAHYDLECDDGFDARLEWSARVLNLHWLASSVIDQRDDLSRRQVWVARAFENE